MKKFMQTHRIYLTPLSPIHIGCGEDFEPTNYVIDNQVLYHFDPSNLYLSEKQRAELLTKANRAELLSIQKFFLENKQQAVHFSHYFSNVSQDIETKWKQKLGSVVQREKEGNVLANLAIERTAYLPYQKECYIPGSSFKGALVTALLDSIHQQKKHSTQERPEHKKLLKSYIGDFENSQMKTVKFGDFMPKEIVHSRIYYSLNYKKKPSTNGNKGKGVSLRRECIVQGQYRAFQSELALWEDKNNSRKAADYFVELNKFYKPIFKQECELLISLGLISSQWVKSIEKLLVNNQVALIRLGKNGADSKVYQAPRMAQIKIMLGGKNKTYKDRSTTLWLAGNQENQSQDLYPFGWALLELDAQQENAELKMWCDQQFKPNELFNKIEFLRNQEIKIAEVQAKEKAEMEERLAKAAEQKAAEKIEKIRLASLSENALLIEEFIQKHQSEEVRQHTNSPVFSEAKKLIEQALAENWSAEDKLALFEKLDLEQGILKTKVQINSEKAKKEFKKLRNKLTS